MARTPVTIRHQNLPRELVNRIRNLLAIGLLALAGAGCGNTHPAPDTARDTVELDRSRFADIYIELRRAAIETDSAPEFEERRREILERYGVTPKDLLDYIEKIDDLQELAVTWDSIYRRLSRAADSISNTDTTAQ